MGGEPAQGHAARLAELNRRPATSTAGSSQKTFTATDCRLDMPPAASPTRDADMAAYMNKLELRVHPDRRGKTSKK